jgi:DNA-directed RNA polymerase II subunit RPB1
LTQLYTNDIMAIYDEYGIEAAKSALISEIVKVMEGGGTNVIHQHLSLLVDTISNTGSLMAINRHGINKLDTDPLSRASFEKTIEQFGNAAIFNEVDKMRSVSACIIMGKPFIGGTGLTDLIIDIDKYLAMPADTTVKNVGFIGDNALVNELLNKKE